MATIHEITEDWIGKVQPPTLAKLQSAIAEFDALAADAARYRWLRHSCCEGYPSGEGSSSKDAYLVITGYDDIYPMTDSQKDAAIDAAMKEE